jgi:16S rRNA (uracil1498-N3)-methyltransferase
VSIKPESGLCLLLAEQERERTLYAAVQHFEKGSIHFAVGPEGGWTAEEEALFIAESWKPVSLGPRILRAETAGITAMAVLAAVLG